MIVYKFPPFEFDPLSGQLRKHGLRIKLQQKPQIILTALLERAGETLTRQELYQRLWPAGVHVDFEQGLNVALKKLRDALCDESDSPAYILTLQGIGYRFIAKVEVESQAENETTIALDAAGSPENENGETGANHEPSPVTNAAGVSDFWRFGQLWSAIRRFPVVFALPALAVTAVVLAFAVRPPSVEVWISKSPPHSPEAAKLYTQGVAELERNDAVDARALLDRVIEIEPDYPLAHAELSRALSKLGFSADARSEAEKALALSSTLPHEEQLLLQAQVSETHFDWEKAIEIYRSLFVLEPRNFSFGVRLIQAETAAGRPAMAMETVRQLRQSSLESKFETELDLAEAEAAGASSDYRREKDAAERAYERARRSGDRLVMARAEIIAGEAQRALGNFPQALALWAEGKKEFASIGDRGSVVRILTDEGKVYWQKGELAKAEQSYEEAMAVSRDIGDRSGLGRALAGLGQIKMFQEGPEEGWKICEQALTEFRQIGNKKEEAYTLSLMADTIAYRHSEARKLYEQSMQVSRDINDQSGVAGRLMDLGIMATVQGDLPTAEQELKESLRIYRDIGERNREALQLSSLAIVYKWQGRLDDAEKNAQQAIAILDEVGETNVRGQVRQNLALIQMEAGKLKDAEQSLRLAMDEHHQANDIGSINIGMVNLAAILAEQGKWQESRDELEKYGKMVHWTYPVGEHLSYLNMIRAQLYAADGQYNLAKREAQEACTLTQKMDQGSVHMKALLLLDQIELQSGNRAVARAHLEQLAREASAKGFGLIRNKAEQTLAAESAELRGAPRQSRSSPQGTSE